MSPTANKIDPDISFDMGVITGLRRNSEVKVQKLLKALRGFLYLIGDTMVKEYILRIKYNTVTHEIEHLSEAFTDEDEVTFIIDGEQIKTSEDMQKLLQSMDSMIIGVA